MKVYGFIRCAECGKPHTICAGWMTCTCGNNLTKQIFTWRNK